MPVLSYSAGRLRIPRKEAPTPAQVPCSPPPVCPSWQARPSYSPALFCRLPPQSVSPSESAPYSQKTVPRAKKDLISDSCSSTRISLNRPHRRLFHSCVAAERLKIMLPQKKSRRFPHPSRIKRTPIIIHIPARKDIWHRCPYESGSGRFCALPDSGCETARPPLSGCLRQYPPEGNGSIHPAAPPYCAAA